MKICKKTKEQAFLFSDDNGEPFYCCAYCVDSKPCEVVEE
jgi:hypothetical protein